MLRFCNSVSVFVSIAVVFPLNGTSLPMNTKDSDIANDFQRLLTRYDSRLKPNYSGDPTLVKLNLLIESIGNINEKDMTFKVNLFLQQRWYDHRLRHNFSKPLTPLLGKKTTPQLIWTPDTYFINTRKGSKRRVPLSNEKLDIFSDGSVFWGIQITLIASCNMDFRHYPLDTQYCGLAIGSYGYTTHHLRYEWFSDPINLLSGQMARFAIENIRNESHEIQYIAGDYSVLKAKFNFRRRTSISIIQIFFPCTAIVCVSWMSFWLHKNCVSARVGVGITTLLTICTIWGSINRQLPQVNYVKAVDIYFICSFSFILAVLIEYSYVMNMKFYKKKQNKLKLRRLKREEILMERQIVDATQTSSYLFKLSLFSQPNNSIHHDEEYYGRDNSNVMKGLDNRGRPIEYTDRLKETIHQEELPKPKVDRNQMPYFYKAYPLIGKPATVDVISRFFFPFCYVCFNIVFWSHYSHKH